MSAQNRISQAPFGTLPDGRQVTQYTLSNDNGMVVRILDLGGIVTQIHVPDRHGVFADVALGFETIEPYITDSPYIGALIGRYGNRIARGRFTLDGKTYQLPVNNGQNHLHGGTPGYDRVLWNASIDGDSLVLRHHSPDGEQGYPGNLDVTATYQLTNRNEIIVRFHAVTDRATPVNLTQHSYFNLRGVGAKGRPSGDVLGHVLTIDADRYIPVDAGAIPLGALAPVAGTPFDFRTPHTIGARIDQPDVQLKNGGGYDHCLVLEKAAGDRTLARAVHAFEPESGRVLELLTQEPGVQFYSGNFLDGSLHGKRQRYEHRGGFCIEPQHYPDAPNQPGYPSTILRPGQVYETESRFRFSVAP